MDFKKETDFIGGVSVKNMRCSMEMLFAEVGKLRMRLGEQAYLLDRYFASLMETVNRVPVYDAVSDGFEAVSELRGICRDIIRRKKSEMDRPFYEQAEDFIGVNPLEYQEVQTKISLYTVMLSGNYLEMMAEQFRGELKSELLEAFDPVGLQKLRGQLSEKLGGTEKMDRIDQLFRQSFMLAFPLVCWLQGAADALLGNLISRDQESSKLIFQLFLGGDIIKP